MRPINCNNKLPTFRSRPDFVKGMPVALEMLRFAAVIPSARFAENVTPGILNEDFFAMLSLLLHIVVCKGRFHNKKKNPY